MSKSLSQMNHSRQHRHESKVLYCDSSVNHDSAIREGSNAKSKRQIMRSHESVSKLLRTQQKVSQLIYAEPTTNWLKD